MSPTIVPASRSLLAGLVVLVLGAAGAKAQAPQPELELEALRAALEKYQDPVVAIHDGYFSTLGCVTIPEPGVEGQVPYAAGGMGIHFLNVSTVGPELDPTKPQILLYEPSEDGLRLVGAEWFVPLATGVKSRPELFGRAFDGPMQGHHPLMPESLAHYDLHVWLFKPNPLGTFSPTNPEVTCEGADYPMVESAPPLVEHTIVE